MTKMYYADAVIGDRRTLRAYSQEEYETTMDEERGGGGDAIEHDTATDTWVYATGSGTNDWCTLVAPAPGKPPLEVARAISALADFAWAD